MTHNEHIRRIAAQQAGFWAGMAYLAMISADKLAELGDMQGARQFWQAAGRRALWSSESTEQAGIRQPSK